MAQTYAFSWGTQTLVYLKYNKILFFNVMCASNVKQSERETSEGLICSLFKDKGSTTNEVGSQGDSASFKGIITRHWEEQVYFIS